VLQAVAAAGCRTSGEKGLQSAEHYNKFRVLINARERWCGVKVIGRRPRMAPYFTKERQSQVSESGGVYARVTDVLASICLI